MSLASLFNFKKSVQYDIVLNGEDEHPKYRLDLITGTSFLYPIYSSSQDIVGRLNISTRKGKKLEHRGISLVLIGEFQDFNNSSKSFEFLRVVRKLSGPETVFGKKSIKFQFKKSDFSKTKKKEKVYESYYGLNVRVRYYLQLIVQRSLGATYPLEKDIWITKEQKTPKSNDQIRMEVGIEDCLHIEFIFKQSKYRLNDVIHGTVNFHNVKIKIVHMEIELLRKEVYGSNEDVIVETETVATYEVMDGCPMKGDLVPIRIYLRPYDLSPTVNKAFGNFSIKYYINLVLVDEEERRFFKQSEVVLWRENTPLPLSTPIGTRSKIVASPTTPKKEEEEEEEEKDVSPQSGGEEEEEEEKETDKAQEDEGSEVDDIQDL